jgi:glycosyltransferase involved in cell wall biosynthesis
LLTSARNQLIPFDEILVYNDCSTDDTAAVAESYNVVVLNGDTNRGCSYGKNYMAAHSKCEWIHFHDADDELLPHFTQLVHQWVSKPNCPDIVLFGYEARDHYTNEFIGIRKFNRDALLTDPIAYAIIEQINPFCGLYNKQSFLRTGGYDTDPLVLYNEDSAFHIKMAIAGLKFDAEDEVSIINYRINTSMSSKNPLKCLIAHYHVLEKTAHKTQLTYANPIASQLWGIAGIFAAYNEWEYVKRVLSLCENLGYKKAINNTKIFIFLTMINPFAAVWFREKMIRLFKPGLRRATIYNQSS